MEGRDYNVDCACHGEKCPDCQEAEANNAQQGQQNPPEESRARDVPVSQEAIPVVPPVEEAKIVQVKEVVDDAAARTTVAECLTQNNYSQLKNWLDRSKGNLEQYFQAGAFPVIGWVALTQKINSDHVLAEWKGKLDENQVELKQTREQIKELQEKEQRLIQKQKELEVEIKKLEEIELLKSEGEAITLLAQQEEKCTKELSEKLKNPYFTTESLELQDISTIFSIFKMDHLFSRFKKNELIQNIEEILIAPTAEVQKNLGYTFEEAVEIQFKLKLFENQEMSVDNHFAKCSICSTKNRSSLLREYGLEDEKERSEIVEKIKGWKDYFLATVNPVMAATDVGLPLGLKLKICLLRLQKVHHWKFEN